MKQGMKALMAALIMATMVAGGCASKDVVKSEEPAVTAPPVKDSAPPQSNAGASDSKIVPAGQGQDKSDSNASSGLATIYFDFDKSDLSKDARDILNKNAQILLKSKADVNIKVEGHCDERGSAEYNLALGERRAKSAQQYLLTLGVQPDRLSVISYGKEKPAVQGSDESAWSKNRRAEFTIAK
jgi:peptidoglycan-associated lipoprotein